MLAQESKHLTPTKVNANSINQMVAVIAARVQQPSGDTAIHFIIEKVKTLCGQDYDCYKILCRKVMDSVKANLNWLPVLPVAKFSLKMARQHGDFGLEADAYRNLAHYYNSFGIQDSVDFFFEKAIETYKKAGNMEMAFKVQINLVDRRLSDGSPASIRELEKLFEEVKKYGIRHSECFVLTRLVKLTHKAGMLDKLAIYVSELEKRTVHPPDAFDEYNFRTYAAIGRANLYLAENPKNLEQANQSFLKALKWSEERPNWLFVVEILQYLSKLEWERKDRELAFHYVDESIEKSKKWNHPFYLSKAYGLKASYAEEEKRYADALYLTRKQHEHSVDFQNSRAGFILRDYYNGIEKDKLATDAKNKALEIEIKSAQLRNSIFAIVFVSLLTALILYGLYKQRKGTQELAAQNALILQQAEKLKTLDDAKSRFFANVSHELRTPLTLMLGPIKTILKGNQSLQEQEQLLTMALKSGQQLQRMVNEILDLQKLEMGKMKLYETPTELLSFFNQHMAQFESLAASGQIDFSYATNIGTGVTAAIDQEKCRQILHNLLSNAFKFTTAGGSIAVKFSLEGNILTTEVTDNGTGIHPDDLPHLFDRYFQTTRPEKPAEGGTGIGLAICKEYVQLLGGKMEVKSELGKGSVFRSVFLVTLSESEEESPVVLESTNVLQPLAKGPQEKVADGSLPTILVVEDNSDLQEYLRILLSGQYNVRLANHGQDALDRCLAQGSQPDLILSDLMMPVMDGYQLLENLKSSDSTRHIPVIMLTARAESRDKLKALRIGVDDYLTKPFEEEELLVRIENLLKNQSIRKQEALPAPAFEPIRPQFSQEDQQWLECFEAYVQKHLPDHTLSISLLGQEFAMSESTLLRKLKRLTGLSPVQYIQETRLDEARRMLERRQFSTIAQVASKVGYDDTRSFSRSFKQRFGKSPSELMGE